MKTDNENPVPWQPCILETWPAIQAKHAYEITLGKMLQPSLTSSDDREVPYLKAIHVQWNGVKVDDLPVMWANATEIEQLALNIGDLLVCEGGEVGRAAILKDSAPHDCIFQNSLHRVRGRQGHDVRYLKYCLKQAAESGWFDVLCNRATIAHFTVEKFHEFRVHLPDPDTQRRIADYLDRETARIDALIAEKEKMLALLEEKRTALISRAVTRGLNPDAPMKPSGLDWLGDIPAHWEIHRLKHLTNEPLAYGANEAALEDNPNWPRFVRITDVNPDGTLRPDIFKSLPPDIAAPFLLESGDILFARSGATVGKSFIYRPEWGEACYAGYLIRFRSDLTKIVPDYIYYFSLSDMYWQQVKTGLIQATIQNFSAEKYGDLYVCVPPLTEQDKIVADLKKAEKRYAQLSSEIRKSITLLKGRRAALITAAVTGELEPGVAA